MIDEIQIQVERRADELSSANIVDRLFERVRTNHIVASNHGKSDRCECFYCQSLYEYVNAKLTRHRIKKRLHHYDADWTIEEIEMAEKRLDTWNQAVHYRRQIKNAAKTS